MNNKSCKISTMHL